MDVTPESLRDVFNDEWAFHPEWGALSSFGLVLSPTIMALLEFYLRHPQSRRSTRVLRQPAYAIRPPDVRRKPLTPFRHGLDQKRLASGEKPDEDE